MKHNWCLNRCECLALYVLYFYCICFCINVFPAISEHNCYNGCDCPHHWVTTWGSNWSWGSWLIKSSESALEIQSDLSVFQCIYLFCIWTWKTNIISASFEICKKIWAVVGALGWLSRQNQHWRFNLTCLCFSICICFCISTWETKNISASLEICKISGPSAGLLAD